MSSFPFTDGCSPFIQLTALLPSALDTCATLSLIPDISLNMLMQSSGFSHTSCYLSSELTRQYADFPVISQMSCSEGPCQFSLQCCCYLLLTHGSVVPNVQLPSHIKGYKTKYLKRSTSEMIYSLLDWWCNDYTPDVLINLLYTFVHIYIIDQQPHPGWAFRNCLQYNCIYRNCFLLNLNADWCLVRWSLQIR